MLEKFKICNNFILHLLTLYNASGGSSAISLNESSL